MRTAIVNALSSGSSSPVTLLAQVVLKYGPITVIAGFLTYYMVGNIAGDIKSMKEDLHSHMSEQHFYLRQLCINTARDERGMQQCQEQPK